MKTVFRTTRSWSYVAAVTVVAWATATTALVGAGSATASPALTSTRADPHTAAIAGEVLSGFDPIGYVTVTVFNADNGRVLGSKVTDVNGAYRIDGLPAARIKVRSSKRGYIADWASHQPNRATATTYTLHVGQVLTQTWDEAKILYMDVATPATIKGQVLGHGKPLPHARVSVLDAPTGVLLNCGVADATGHYVIGSLHTGPVKVRATKPGWITEYANNKPTLAEADVLMVYDVIDQAQHPDVLQLDLTHT